MKWFKIIIFLAVTSTALAGNRFDQMEAYREIQRLMLIEGQNRPALELAMQLLEQLDQKDDLYKEVKEIMRQLGDGNPQFPLDKAIKFATGRKDEIFCKNIGLVFLEARHNDGTVSTVRLINSNRELGGTYSLIENGSWVYELDTEYREPIRSESWLDEATDHSYKMKEVRNRGEGRIDHGKWTRSWNKNGDSGSYSTRGETPEPLPMHLANDYPLWGTYDMGFKIQFSVGFKDKVSDRQTGAPKAILLKTEREVVAKLLKFAYTDAKGNNHEYPDCFKVRSIIQLDRLEDDK
jgi:hypothetical protein